MVRGDEVYSKLDCIAGGTFALYSLLKRAGDFRTFGSAHPADTKLESYSTAPGLRQKSQSDRAYTYDTDWRTGLARNISYQKVSEGFILQAPVASLLLRIPAYLHSVCFIMLVQQALYSNCHKMTNAQSKSWG